MSKGVQLEGTVIAEHRNGYDVQSEHGIHSCTLGGKLQVHHIRVVVGDNVTIEVSPYDLAKGRIVFRNPA